jgi:hypothetical protein
MLDNRILRFFGQSIKVNQKAAFKISENKRAALRPLLRLSRTMPQFYRIQTTARPSMEDLPESSLKNQAI